jgi:citrate lyase subunit beta/citryl-CoA lyase
MASYRRCSDRLEGLTWGAEDLSADLGAEANRHSDGSLTGPYLLARNLTLIAAIAADIAPIDTVYTNFRDLVGLREEAVAARRDGFTGKMAIHPAQVAVINEVFTPTREALAKAQAIIAAFAAKPDAGVVAIDGEMFDRPHLVRAERIAARAKTQDDRAT